MTDDDLLLPAHCLQKNLATGQLDPIELYASSLERSRLIAGLNAFRDLEEENGHAAAERSAFRYRRLSELGKIDGLPVGIKDGFSMRGSVARKGSATTPDEPGNEDGPVIAALRRAGFVPAGRTTMPEFGWKGVTDSVLCGITRNPWDPELTSGGSSGGSAVAVATGACALAVGTDIGGSIRIPASFNGVVGFKPTQDRSPRKRGSHSGVLSREGPMTRSVLDVAHMLDATELRDQTGRYGRMEPHYFEQIADGELMGLEVALLLDHPELDVHPEIAEITRNAAIVLQDLGCHVEEIDRRHLNLGGIRETYETLYSADVTITTRKLSDEQRKQLDPGLLELTRWVETFPLSQYLDARDERVEFLQRTEAFYETWDLLLTPTVALPPFAAGANVPENWSDSHWTSWAAFTWAFNLTGEPALSLPGGFTESGLPVGVQICSARGRDGLVLRAANLLERTLALDVASAMQRRLNEGFH